MRVSLVAEAERIMRWHGCRIRSVLGGSVIMSRPFYRQARYAPSVMGLVRFIRRVFLPSSDGVSELDKHEVTKAVDNAVKERERRFDLRGKCSLEHKDKTVTITAEASSCLSRCSTSC